MVYQILQLTYDSPTQLEQLGTKAKYWFRDQDGQRVMFKLGRPGTGENWAEKVGCELCTLLDIPHAHYELAVWKGQKGVLTRNFVPDGARLVFGNELLSRLIDDYDENKRYEARQHTVRTVMKILSNQKVKFPIGWNAPDEITDAAGVFLGYLMLDALMGNQDRHHENWGLIWAPNLGVFFAPTFDHASSLGRNESDETRNEMLTTRDKGRSVAAYVSRARSALFLTPHSAKPLKTIEAFSEAIKLRPKSKAADYWKRKLAAIDEHQFREILWSIPDREISDIARNFALEMLKVNANRILTL